MQMHGDRRLLLLLVERIHAGEPLSVDRRAEPDKEVGLRDGRACSHVRARGAVLTPERARVVSARGVHSCGMCTLVRA